MLSENQLKFVADVLDSIGQVSLASLVLPYFISGLNTRLVIAGILATLGSWFIGLAITKK